MIHSVLELGKVRHRRTLDRVGGISTVIGPGSKFTGTLQGSDNIVVLGRVEGDCDLNATIVLEEPGYFEGNITAENVVIAGEVKGNVTARNKLEIVSSARIIGDVSGEVIAIAEGASVQGQMRTAGAKSVTRFAEKRQEKPEYTAKQA